MDAKSAELTWDIERELVLSRVFDAPRELVFKAWTEKEHLPKWFGPKGYACTTREIDVRVGGRWRYDMTGPEGQLWSSRMVFLEVKYPERIVYDHGADKDDDPDTFRVLITFDEQSNKKTVVTMRTLLPTLEQRKIKMGFGAVELGNQTLDKLAAHIEAMRRQSSG